MTTRGISFKTSVHTYIHTYSYLFTLIYSLNVVYNKIHSSVHKHASITEYGEKKNHKHTHTIDPRVKSNKMCHTAREQDQHSSDQWQDNDEAHSGDDATPLIQSTRELFSFLQSN